MTHLELNAFLRDTMASRSLKLKEAFALEESAKEDFYNDIVLSTDEEDFGAHTEAEQSDSCDSEAEDVHNTENEELAAEVQVSSGSQVYEATGLLDNVTTGLVNASKTQLLSNNQMAASSLAYPATGDSLAVLSLDLTETTSNMRLLNITYLKFI
ncbi:hypothetical protein DSO57_1003791 [Entomophthora muscae]|uniref:Uncharacterized protein n=1 Tax=Entomophthora muscae TaxID=34485 RepID=A0ACC2UH96_9FUNG|nr:hypothetical protein DSO57_1003791 [Entomophthora muscae]